MAPLLRKILIYAGKDGLLLIPHGHEQHQSLHIEYKSRTITTKSRQEANRLKTGQHVEVQGVVGLIQVASFSFLIAITHREQVAQIFGKPIYTITDVAILPLSSQIEADEAIGAASKTQHSEDDISESDYDDSEDDHHSVTTTEASGSPGEEFGHYFRQNRSNTSIAEEVAKRKASYGKFASRWFSRQVWGSNGEGTGSTKASKRSTSGAESNSETTLSSHPGAAAAETNEESKQDTAEQTSMNQDPAKTVNASAVSLLPKILRSTKMILSSRSFYFAYEFDLTRRLSLQWKRTQMPTRDKLDSLYFWNRRMSSAFSDIGHDSFIVPIIQGFVGQRVFSVSIDKEDEKAVEVTHEAGSSSTSVESKTIVPQQREYLLTLISRRSVKRSGLRYLRRGIDDEGNCANTVETEQMLSSTTWEKGSTIRTFVQLRGSIPLYFSQSPYSLKPAPVFHNSHSNNEAAFRRHFQALKDQYGGVQISVLVDKHGTEVAIGEAYEKMYKNLRQAGQLHNVDFNWFDFHSECRGMKFENVQRLVDTLQSSIDRWSETVIVDDEIKKKQEGIIRTNCMDCLDRTNVAQSAFGQYVLQCDLNEDGFNIDLLHDESTNWFNTLWADNGDAISRQYASTAALKGDFTRTRKRNWRGQMNDLGLTLSRYYSNMVNDYFLQTVIDFLLANVSWRTFEDFESTMMSADPGISVESARQGAIENCAKIVIHDSDEDIIHGWTVLTPAQENTLRTLPFEETVVLLTNAAVYCCKFDWNTEKVASFEKVDLRSISKIRLGTYITSTFTERQLDEQLNQGLVIVFTPGKGDIIRVNTRSLQNSVDPEEQNQSATETGTGILSWFAPRGSAQITRAIALKVIPRTSNVQTEDDQTNKSSESPYYIASQIAIEIKRAVVGPDHVSAYPAFIEEGDIISAADAKKRTGYLEQLGHSIRKMVWA